MSSKMKAAAYALGLVALTIVMIKVAGSMATINPKVPNMYAPNFKSNAKDRFFMKVPKQDRDHIIKNVIMIKPERAREINKFKLETIQGGVIDTENFKGKVTLLYVWGVFVHTPPQELPQIAELDKKYGSDGFNVYGVVARSSKEELDEFLKVTPVKIETALAEGETPIAISFLPANIFLDKQARVRAYITGKVEDGVREFIIEKLLKE